MSPRTTTSVVAFYMAGRSKPFHCELAAELMGAVVFRGQQQENDALRAKAQGATVWLDPAGYEKPHRRQDEPSLFAGDPWAEDQRAIGVAELLSPGVYVPPHDTHALDMAVASQAKWLDAEGGGRLALVLDRRWLTDGLGAVSTALEVAGHPIAIALADSKDPLAHRGAVRGLARLASSLSDLMVLRCDMGAIGAIAHGATVGAIGTGTSVRHVVPPGTKAHGGGQAVSNVFVERLVDFRSPKKLSALPSRLKPTCRLTCCDGAPLDRFFYMGDDAGARVHNLHSLARVADQILSVDEARRPAAWKQMCIEAVASAQRIRMDSGQPFEIRRQIAAWASL
jgi:hypothetical protein